MRSVWHKMQWLILFSLFFVIGSFGFKNSFEVKALSDDNVYEKLQIFSDVLERVQQNYVKEVDTNELIYGAIEGMLDSLDAHSSFLKPEIYKELQVETKGSFGGLGIEITIRDGILTIVSPIEDTPAFEAGLKASDRIVKISGEFTKGMSLIEAVKMMRGKKGTKITITIAREGIDEPFDVTLVRAVIKIRSVKSKRIDEDYGYIRIVQFQEKTGRDLKAALKRIEAEIEGGIKGLVLDLRNNPGGLLDQAVKVADEFLSSGKIVYTDGRMSSQKMEFYAHPLAEKHDYPIIVLVNGGSASASEIVAGALQDHHRAVVLGTPSFGKGSVQTIMPLNDGSGLKLTTAQYFTPNGQVIQAQGIQPDILVSNKVPEEAGKPIKYLREKDLKKYLRKNDIGDVNEDDKDDTEDNPAEKEEAGDDDAEPPDIQLNRALEILKSWQIFMSFKNQQQTFAMDVLSPQH